MFHSARIHGLRSAAVVLTTVAAVAAASPSLAAARTDASSSTNWSGYAVHRSGVRFRTATASWRQPTAQCTSHTATYSSVWVGIGGYSRSSDALEQIGTELDCSRQDASRSSAWYELVPAASHTIHMTIASGDRLSAAVTVRGHRVTLLLVDDTRSERFQRTFTDRTIDQTSAEWIVEAPSTCTGSRCTILPLTDFATADFLDARATTTAGTTASLAANPWLTSEITLASASTATASDIETSVTASPSTVSDALGAFAVTYASKRTTTSGPTGPPTTGGAPGSGGPGGGPADAVRQTASGQPEP